MLSFQQNNDSFAAAPNDHKINQSENNIVNSNKNSNRGKLKQLAINNPATGNSQASVINQSSYDYLMKPSNVNGPTHQQVQRKE